MSILYMKGVKIMNILNTKTLQKSIILYLIYTVILIAFNLIGKYLYHISSIFINFAFLIPLILGFGILLIIKIKKIKITKLSFLFYNLAIIMLSFYSIYKGIAEIYRISNELLNILFYTSNILFILSFLSLLPIIFLHFFPIDSTISSK